VFGLGEEGLIWLIRTNLADATTFDELVATEGAYPFGAATKALASDRQRVSDKTRAFALQAVATDFPSVGSCSASSAHNPPLMTVRAERGELLSRAPPIDANP